MVGAPQGRQCSNMPLPACRRFLAWICGIIFIIVAAGCAHYPVNQPLRQADPQAGYRGRNLIDPDNDDQLLLLLTFSGGGTRAAAFSYGVLETFRDTAVSIRGRQARLLDEVDWISGVSGGSFTAAYYGLFRDRIFEDFETRFLKKNIQGDLTRATLFNPINWGKLFSAYYDRSDLAADYYDKHVFEGKTFGDLLARKEPMIVINATDMVHGTRFSFIQDVFDVICSDLSTFPVARACAASSAVPMVLSPVTLRNYAGECGFQMPTGAGRGHATAQGRHLPPFRSCQQHAALSGFQEEALHPPGGRGGCRQPGPSSRPGARHADGRSLDHLESTPRWKTYTRSSSWW